MEKLEIYKFQLGEILDALHITANIHDSRNKDKQNRTCHDRTVARAEQYAKNAINKNIDKIVKYI